MTNNLLNSSNSPDHEADDRLDRAIRAILSTPAPLDVRDRLLKKASAWTSQPWRNSGSHKWRTGGAIAASALLAIIAFWGISKLAFVRPIARRETPAQTEPVTSNSVAAQENRPQSAVPAPNAKLPISIAAKWTTQVRYLIAENAPIIVASGGKAPIHLGARVPQGDWTGSLHIWDWTQSPTSRVNPQIEWWSNEQAAISPDGKLLLWAKGDILDLQNGGHSHIDLGGENQLVENAAYRRIGELRFSPDGARLALTVTKMSDATPGLIQSQALQIFEFPGGKKLCEFPIQDDRALRFAFSPDGKQILCADFSKEVVLHDAADGSVLRRYEPKPDAPIRSLAFSPKAGFVAALQATPSASPATAPDKPDLLIWDASGKLIHRINAVMPGNRPGNGALCFSPDEKRLAVDAGGEIRLLDVLTGKTAVIIKESSASIIRWSRDGRTIIVMTPYMGSDDNADAPGRFDVYPSIHEWDAQTGVLVKSLDPSRLGK